MDVIFRGSLPVGSWLLGTLTLVFRAIMEKVDRAIRAMAGRTMVAGYEYCGASTSRVSWGIVAAMEKSCTWRNVIGGASRRRTSLNRYGE